MQGPKRPVKTCHPCYTRKQRCDRQYPCNRCIRRRRPEECVYRSPPREVSSHQGPVNEVHDQPGINIWPVRETLAADSSSHWSSQHSALVTSFGYFEESSSNTIALLRGLNLSGTATGPSDQSPAIRVTIQHELNRMPDRCILDFLVQYFVQEVNWMKQVIHGPSFLTDYQQWWAKDSPSQVVDIEFASLILHLGSFTTQFLPSASHPVNQIQGQSLSDIRDLCSDIGRNLANACETLDWKGSLIRVQHCLFAALTFGNEGRIDKLWEGVVSASQAALKAAIHVDASRSRKSPLTKEDSAQELKRDIERRTFCSLYALDCQLSRTLDRAPSVPAHLVADTLPRLRLIPDIDASAPDIFTSRLIEVQLSQFWQSFGSQRNTPYDPTDREQRYEKLCTEYIPSLHKAFTIVNPDTTWDQVLPKLPMQRQFTYIAIFDSICWNFRPILLLKPNYIVGLPPYKQVLLQSQKRRLGMAALKKLEAISYLQVLFGGPYKRFASPIFSTFEAVVLLLVLCTYTDFPFKDNYTDVLGIKVQLTYKNAVHAAEQAIDRLRILAEFSDMARYGAHVGAQLLSKAIHARESSSSVVAEGSSTGSSTVSAWPGSYARTIGINGSQGQWPLLEPVNLAVMSDSFSSMGQGTLHPTIQMPSTEFPVAWANSGF